MLLTLAVEASVTGSNVASEAAKSLKPIGEERLKKNMIGFGSDGVRCHEGAAWWNGCKVAASDDHRVKVFPLYGAQNGAGCQHGDKF